MLEMQILWKGLRMEEKIKNVANVPYEIIGALIDNYLEIVKGKEYEQGWLQYWEFEYKKESYTIYIKYLKKYRQWIIVKNDEND